MKVLNHKGCHGAHGKSQSAERVEAHLGFQFLQFGVKCFESKPAELSRLAAARSWRLTRADFGAIANFKTFEFTGVNRSGVVPTWRDSSPSAYSLCGGNYGEGITNIDVNHFVPTDTDCHEWVGDNHAFIVDFDLGANENHVCADACCSRPKCPGNRENAVFGQPQGKRKEQAEGKGYASQNITASRSKDFFITHVSIIAGEK